LVPTSRPFQQKDFFTGWLDRSRGNAAINGEHEDPFAAILQMYEGSGVPRAGLDRVFELTIANSSVISYLHLGRPETILIDLPERIEEQFKQMAKQDVR